MLGNLAQYTIGSDRVFIASDSIDSNYQKSCLEEQNSKLNFSSNVDELKQLIED
jgi:hypothetical protein